MKSETISVAIRNQIGLVGFQDFGIKVKPTPKKSNRTKLDKLDWIRLIFRFRRIFLKALILIHIMLT